MKIGIIGAGMIGATLARLFAEQGHEVVISNSRGPQTLDAVVNEIGHGVRAMTAEKAADFGDIVVEAIPYGHYKDLPAILLAEKILISASNYYPDRDGIMDLNGRSQTELIALHLPATKVIKAFNTIWYQDLATQGDSSLPLGQRRVIFLAGDDEEAKMLVASLIKEIGFAPLDTGSLAHSKVQEPGAAIYNVDMTLDEARALLDK
jgi:predicted dinucleotide-binding enzyme